jgi:hypothetical protein
MNYMYRAAALAGIFIASIIASPVSRGSPEGTGPRGPDMPAATARRGQR